MKREDLKEIGLDDEAVDKVFGLYGKSVEKIKDERDSFKSQVDGFDSEREQLNQQLKERSKELDTLREDVEAGKDLKDQIDLLKQSHAEKEKQMQQQLNQTKLDYELDKSLDQYGVKNSSLVKRLINQDDVKLSEEGNGLIGLDEQIEQLKQTDDYLFNTTTDSSDGGEGAEGNEGSDGQSNNNFVGYGSNQQQGNEGQKPKPGDLGRKNAQRLFNTKED